MADWKKIDDTTCNPDQPYSAFLTKRLTANVNSYPEELARHSLAAWPFENPVRWASYGQPTGTVLVCDCGLNARRITFRISFQTETRTAGGRFLIRHVDSGVQTGATIYGDAAPQTVDIDFLSTVPLTGSHAFFVGWISADDEPLGTVAVKGGVANQIYLASGGTWSFPVAAGQSAEMHARLHFSNNPNVGELAPFGNARLDYQVCLFSHRQGNNPAAVFTIWPELEQTPAFLPTFYDGNLQMTGTLIGLGTVNLYGISMAVVQWEDGTLVSPTAFSQTTPQTRMPNNIGNALVRLRPALCSHVSSTGMLGCVLPAETPLSFAFAVQNKGDSGLAVTFRAFGYNGAENPAPDFTLTVFEALTDNVIIGPVTLSKIPIARMQPQTTETESAAAAFAVNGIVASEGKWGLRDSMTMTQTNRGTTVRFITDAVPLNPVETGGANAYYATITATSDVYIYGLSARLN